MATLEKIRSKSVLLVSIIFVALFLFIITIIDNPMSLFVDQTTVVNVDGQKVDYEHYQQLVNQIHEQNPQAGDVEAGAINQLIMEALFNREFDKLGITVTSKELSDALVGENAIPGLVQQFNQMFGATPDVVLAALQNPSANGLDEQTVAQLSKAYADFENNVESMLKQQKLMMLIGGAINANKLDAKALYDDGSVNYTLNTVSKNVSEKLDTVSAADIDKFYNDHIEQYSIRTNFGVDEPKRYIRYVTLDIAPSPADRQKAIKQANEALAMVQNSQNMDTLTGNSAFVVTHNTHNAAGVKGAGINGLEEFLTTAEPGTAQIVGGANTSSSNIVIARLMSRGQKVNAGNVVVVQPGEGMKADSVLNLINSGVKPDSIKGVQAAPAQHVEFAQLGATGDSLRNAGVGKYIAMGNGMIAGLTSTDEPEETYDYYTAVLTVEPSHATIDKLNTRMRDFLINASTADKFTNETAVPHGLTVINALVGNSDASINNLDDSRGMIAWAMSADKGDVSRLFTNSKNTRLTALAVIDEYKHYIGQNFPDLREGLTAQAQIEKTADNLIAKTAGKGKTLADYQKLLNVARVDTMRGVNFAGGRYAALAGARAHKKGDVVGPLRWNNTVMVYQIANTEKSPMPFDQKAAEAEFKNRATQSIMGGQQIMSLFLGNGKIDNRILKFTRQD